MGPLVVNEVADHSAHVEMMDYSRGNVAVRTGVKTATESLEGYTGGYWAPEKFKEDFGTFKAQVLAQESFDEHVRLVSLACKSNGFSGSLR